MLGTRGSLKNKYKVFDRVMICRKIGTGIVCSVKYFEQGVEGFRSEGFNSMTKRLHMYVRLFLTKENSIEKHLLYQHFVIESDR